MSGQTRFFKATRPDGTDFYTATVDYAEESGETRRLFARDAARIITVVQEWGRES